MPAKYDNPDYEEVEPNIYRTYEKESDTCLSLIGVTDSDELKLISSLSGWEQGKDARDRSFLVLAYNGKRYYKNIDKRDGAIYRNRFDDKNVIYVTSLMFEQEPEYEENTPESAEVSQYPLEDILDEFLCAVEDFYEEENRQDAINSYIEFSSPDIDDIRNLLSIVGKHLYNKEDGGYMSLVIE